MTFCEFIQAGDSQGTAQQALGAHQHEGFAEIPFHLPAQQVEVLARSGQVADLHILFGAELQKALEVGAGVLRPLPFVAVGQEQHQSAGALPFGFRCGEKRVDDHLGSVGEIAKLGLPDHEGSGRVQGEAVLKSQDGVLRQGTVVGEEASLVVGQMVQRHVGKGLAALRVPPGGVALAEGAPLAVLPAKPYGNAFLQERSQRQCLGEGPVHRTFLFEALLLVCQDALQLGMDVESLGYVGQSIGDPQ